MVKAFPEPIRELLVYHFCVLNSTPQFVLENIFLPNGAQIRTLQKLKARLKYMTNDDRAAYVEGLDCPITKFGKQKWKNNKYRNYYQPKS